MNRSCFSRRECSKTGEHTPGAKAPFLPILNAWAKARAYLRSNGNGKNNGKSKSNSRTAAGERIRQVSAGRNTSSSVE